MLNLPEQTKKGLLLRMDMVVFKFDKLLGHLSDVQKKSPANYLVELDTRKKEW